MDPSNDALLASSRRADWDARGARPAPGPSLRGLSPLIDPFGATVAAGDRAPHRGMPPGFFCRMGMAAAAICLIGIPLAPEVPPSVNLP